MSDRKFELYSKNRELEAKNKDLKKENTALKEALRYEKTRTTPLNKKINLSQTNLDILELWARR